MELRLGLNPTCGKKNPTCGILRELLKLAVSQFTPPEILIVPTQTHLSALSKILAYYLLAFTVLIRILLKLLGK